MGWALVGCAREPESLAKKLKYCPSGYSSVDDCQSNIKWPDGSQIALHFDASMTPGFRKPILDAVDELNTTLAATRFDLDPEARRLAPPYSGDPSAMSRDGVNGVYIVGEPWPFPNSPDSDAMTVTSFNAKNIIEMDIYFRARSYPADIAKQARALRFARVMALHELLHGLGLSHSDAPDALMQPVLRSTFIDRHLGSSDLLVLSREYALRSNVVANQ